MTSRGFVPGAPVPVILNGRPQTTEINVARTSNKEVEICEVPPSPEDDDEAFDSTPAPISVASDRRSLRRRDSKTTFFETLDHLLKLQGSRMDDQRVEFHPNSAMRKKSSSSNPSSLETRQLISRLIQEGEPYPMVVLPRGNAYSLEDNLDFSYNDRDDIYIVERDQASGAYRQLFWGRHHFNYYGEDDRFGDVVVSIKRSNPLRPEISDGRPRKKSVVDDFAKPEVDYHVIIRAKDTTLHEVVTAREGDVQISPQALIKTAFPSTEITLLTPTLAFDASEMLLDYDEHNRSTCYKFGVILQRRHQVTEEEMFNNLEDGGELTRFMDFVAERVPLQGFRGFRGGLDVRSNHTGTESYYARLDDREIMFHVSTMLPYLPNDKQQLQRKRHVGNDMVCIVFQECNTPFSPDMIASHFLQVFVVVHPLDAERYRVSVTRRGDVPDFAPPLPEGGIFFRDETFQDFLLAKLINAEHACYETRKLREMTSRTRATLFEVLYQEIREKNETFLEASTLNVVDVKKLAAKREKEAKKIRKKSRVKTAKSFGFGSEDSSEATPERKTKSISELLPLALSSPSSFMSHSSTPSTPQPQKRLSGESSSLKSQHLNGSTTALHVAGMSQPPNVTRVRRMPVTRVDLNANHNHLDGREVTVHHHPDDEAISLRSNNSEYSDENAAVTDDDVSNRRQRRVANSSPKSGADDGNHDHTRKASFTSSTTNNSNEISLDSAIVGEDHQSLYEEIQRLVAENKVLRHQVEHQRWEKTQQLPPTHGPFFDMELKQTTV